MTKLFSRTFASAPEDAKIDREILEKIALLQTFLKPEHLDIPAVLHNEASWLVCMLALSKSSDVCNMLFMLCYFQKVYLKGLGLYFLAWFILFVCFIGMLYLL